MGEFLRMQRDRVTPADVGLSASGRRQVSGLRREEVALLAGVSVDYYVRLERGRERHPSGQVLDALSAALNLDDDGRLHLFRLGGLAPRPRADLASQRIDPHLLQLLDTWSYHPALVLGRAYDVLARNTLGDALFSGFRSGPNLLHAVFLDPDARSFYADWESAAANTVAGFRLLHSAAPDDFYVREILRGLLDSSPEFAFLWGRHEVRGKGAEVKRFVHAEVGELKLRMQAFDVRSTPGQQLVVNQAEPGSSSADRLTLLGSLAATRGHL